ncbi:MAG: peptidoglycan-binding protein [bacterium]|nr:peptidoglycan-binding protein [bacterium]
MIKKYLTVFTVVSIVLGNSLVASAQTTTTTTTSLQALIQSLQAQITALNAQIEIRNKANAEIKAVASEIKGTLKLISKLREGASGDDVRLLQEILASDSSIYPEGRITGFFGRLTAQAVKRFQKKHGLEQVGNVGPKTLEKLNKELEKNPIAKENDDGNKKDNENRGEERHCAIVPPGHLIAQGWLKKHDGVRPILPPCQKLPPGIEKLLDKATSTATSTPDVVAPVISSVSSASITSTGAHITWLTNESSTSKVWQSTSTPVNVSGTPTVSDVALVTGHDLTLSDLVANTTYYYVVGSADAAGNASLATQGSFTTLPTPDTTSPVLSGVSATSISSSSAHVVWTTNEAATSKVSYGTSTPVDTVNAPMVNDGSFVTSHDLALSSLTASTTYYYVVTSWDAAANTATSSEASFITTE